MRSRTLFFLLIFICVLLCAREPAAAAPQFSPEQAQSLVQRALDADLRGVQDASHPMRFRLQKTSPRLSSLKEIVESRDGDVARLLQVNGRPLPPADEQIEQTRLDALLADPGRQRHRKQSEDSDMAVILKILRMLPGAFLYLDAGPVGNPAGSQSGALEKFSFRPNPAFHPPDMESQALTTLTGELWVDPGAGHVARLEGHLQSDTSYGLGLLGKLDKGGWVVIEQADVGNRVWRITRFRMRMNLRILWKTKILDSSEEFTGYTPVPAGLDYRQAIRMLRQ